MRLRPLSILLSGLVGLSLIGPVAAGEPQDCRPGSRERCITQTPDPAWAYRGDGDRWNRHDRYDDRYSDAAIHDRVQRALWRTLGPRAQRIDVRVRGGSVFLSGVVFSRGDHASAAVAAYQVRGVRFVNTYELVVRRG